MIINTRLSSISFITGESAKSPLVMTPLDKVHAIRCHLTKIFLCTQVTFSIHFSSLINQCVVLYLSCIGHCFCCFFTAKGFHYEAEFLQQ